MDSFGKKTPPSTVHPHYLEVKIDLPKEFDAERVGSGERQQKEDESLPTSFRLFLHKNLHLFHRQYTESYYAVNASYVFVPSHLASNAEAQHCFYQGHVEERKSNSIVAISTCHDQGKPPMPQNWTEPEEDEREDENPFRTLSVKQEEETVEAGSDSPIADEPSASDGSSNEKVETFDLNQLRLNGVIYHAGRQWVIESAHSRPGLESHHHIIYDLAHLSQPPREFAGHFPSSNLTRDLSSRASSRRLLLRPSTGGPYFISVAAVSDHLRYIALTETVFASTVNVYNMVDALYQANPLNPALRVRLSAQIVFSTSAYLTSTNGKAQQAEQGWLASSGPTGLVNVDPYTLQPQFDGPPILSTNEVTVSSLWDAFTGWSAASANLPAGLLPATSADVRGSDPYRFSQMMLLSGYNFQGSLVGFAAVGAMCTSSARAIVQGYSYHDVNIAQTATHQTGHILGMGHDGPLVDYDGANNNGCSNLEGNTGRRTIMARAAQFSNQAQIFSSCSQREWSTFWNTTSDVSCLSPVSNPNQTRTEGNAAAIQWKIGVCGNGLIEGNEQCDCVASQQSACAAADPCCDYTICQLKAGSICSLQQPCCSASNGICSFTSASSNTICRTAADPTCDQPEYCSGNSSSCPRDVFSSPSTSCNDTILGSQGQCFAGSCKTADRQCADYMNGYRACPVALLPLSASQASVQYCSTIYCLAPGGASCTALTHTVNIGGGLSAQAMWANDGNQCTTLSNALSNFPNATVNVLQCNKGQCVPSQLLDVVGYYTDTPISSTGGSAMALPFLSSSTATPAPASPTAIIITVPSVTFTVKINTTLYPQVQLVSSIKNEVAGLLLILPSRVLVLYVGYQNSSSSYAIQNVTVEVGFVPLSNVNVTSLPVDNNMNSVLVQDFLAIFNNRSSNSPISQSPVLSTTDPSVPPTISTASVCTANCGGGTPPPPTPSPSGATLKVGGIAGIAIAAVLLVAGCSWLDL